MPLVLRSLLILAACLAWLLPPAAAAPGPAVNEAAIEEVAAKVMREQSIPGMAVGVLHEGKLIYAKGFGKANLEWNQPVTPDTVFMIGSISKPMLAVGINLLAERGKLGLDDPVSKHIPGTPASWQGITLRHLLNHTSGLRRESPAFDGDKPQPDIELIKATFAMPLDFPTGSKIQYCNICYFTLAEVISRVSGEAWGSFMAREVFAPAGMTVTRTTSNVDLIPQRAGSYMLKDGKQLNVPEWAALRPSGAFASSLNDMARWEAALYANKILKAETLAAMARPGLLADGKPAPFGPPGGGYGLGWALSQVQGQRRVAHGGALAGFRSMHARYPDSGLAIIVLTNGAGARTEQIESLLAQHVLNRP